MFAHCGLATDEATCAGWLEAYSLDHMTAGEGTIVIGGAFAEDAAQRTEPEGFFGRGDRGAWGDAWTTEDRLGFDAVAGDLLVELGYAGDHAWAGDDRARRVIAAQRVNRDGGHGRDRRGHPDPRRPELQPYRRNDHEPSN